jgi:hypothetical protein
VSVREVLAYIPPGPESARWLDECIRHCTERGYNIVAVVTRWEDVIRYVRRGYQGVVVSPPPELLPADRWPRMEYIGTPEATPQAPRASGQRRVQRKRRIPEEG